MKKYWWIFLIASPLLAFVMLGALVWYLVAGWQYTGSESTFTIRPGEPFSSINARLAQKKIISNSKVFYRYCKLTGELTSFRAGTFRIETPANMLDIIETLTEGHSIAESVTVPEGKNLYEIAEIFAEEDITKKEEFLRLAKDASLAKEFGIPAGRLEGYLYPDTYKFEKKTPAKTVLETMVRQFFLIVEELDIQNTPMNLSLHELVTLASIVEKETGAGFERPVIAGVFYNRLKKKMRLQSDPTTIYGIYEDFDGNLKKKHLYEKTPYNTYKISGLPKGPIANPGKESLKAVLNPEAHSYLYFVSKNDGTHIFSKTYREHAKAVEAFQKNREARAGKSWRDLNQ